MQFVQIIVTGCITTLFDTVKRPNYDQIIEEQTSSELLVECIELLATLISEKELYEIFALYQRNLIIEVSLLMM